MKRHAGYEPRRRQWIDVCIFVLGFLAIVAVIAAYAVGQEAVAVPLPGLADPYLTPTALAALRPDPTPRRELFGAAWRNTDTSVTFACPNSEGQVVLLGFAALPTTMLPRPRPIAPWGGTYPPWGTAFPPVVSTDPAPDSDWTAIGWPFLPDSRIEALPHTPTIFGDWRLRDWPTWAVTGPTILPLPPGPHCIQPAIISGGMCRVCPPLLLDR